MTYTQFLTQCRKMKNAGWEAGKASNGVIRMRKKGDNWNCAPLSAVCFETTGNAYSSPAEENLKNDLHMGSLVAKWIQDATEYYAQDFRTKAGGRRRNELLTALGIRKERLGRKVEL